MYLIVAVEYQSIERWVNSELQWF